MANLAAKRVAWAALLILTALVYLMVSMNRLVNLTDEGLVLFGAERVLHGDVPHRDFFTLYGPAQFYLLAGLFKVFGSSVLVERIWDTAVRCGCAALVFVVVRLAAPTWAALLAAAASAIWLASFQSYGYPVFPALAAVLGGTALLASVLAGTKPASLLVPAGACAGLAAMFRYDVGVASFGVQCIVLTCAIWSQRLSVKQGLRAVLRSILLFGSGFSVVVVPVAAIFTATGVVPDLLYDVVTWPARSYVKARSLPFPSVREMWWHLEDSTVYLPLVICAAALPTLIETLRRRKSPGNPDCFEPPTADWIVLPWLLLLLIVMTLTLFGKGMVRVQPLHMGMALVTSLALMGVLIRPMRQRSLLARGAVAAALLVTGVLTWFNMLPGLHHAVQNIAWVSDPASWSLSASSMPPALGSCRVRPELARMACFYGPPEEAETIVYVDDHTASSDPLFSGLSRHDKVFVNDIFLYFATNRASATKWYEFVPGLQTTAPIQEQIVSELEREKPELIVLESTWESSDEPNDSSVSSGVTILDDYLKRTYKQAASFGPNTILRAR